jgi:HPt (histidine-containing phosphotransfer) domain-containing protein
VIDDIRQKFLPRFVATARERLERASKAIADGADAAPSIAADLHTIAGEASIMGLHDVAQLAREGERAVRIVGGVDDANILMALYKLWRRIDELVPQRRAGSG